MTLASRSSLVLLLPVTVQLLKTAIRFVLILLYRVQTHGLEHYYQAGNRVLIIANHTSFLDAVLLAVFLPERVTFTVDTQIARLWWVRLGLALVDFFPMDPSNPLAVKSLIQYLSQNRKESSFRKGVLLRPAP